MVTLFGIPNCDTVKKARRWLDQRDTAYTFHDFRKDGLTEKDIISWLQAVPAEKIINKKSTAWRALTPAQQTTVTALEPDNHKALKLLCTHPTLIKRPVLVLQAGKVVTTGFSESAYKTLFNK